MPELPEVQSLATFLRERLSGLSVEKVSLQAFSALKTFDPPLDSLAARKVTDVVRRGKFLVFVFGKAEGDVVYLAIHLSRAGWLRWAEEAPTAKAGRGKSPVALRMSFSDGSGATLTEAGTEKRLAVYVVRSLDEVEHIRSLGIDPLMSDAVELGAVIRGQSGRIKNVLTDQQVIAGVGNAYSDEALHVAKLSPYKGANKLTEAEALALAEAIQQVLSEAVERAADTPVAGLKKEKKSSLRVHGKAGESCPVCGDTIREVSFSSKSFQYCPTCQTGGKPLADRRMSRLLK
jgi:formamidopyrimidine-DNA glycosylase